MRNKIILFFFCVLSYVYANAQALDSGLILCLPLDGAIQDALGNYETTNYGAVPYQDRFGNDSSAVSLNGTTQYFEIEQFGRSCPTSEFSVSFWAKTRVVQGHFLFVLYPMSSSNRLSLVINYNHSSTPYHFFDVKNTGTGRLGVSPISVDTFWHHYVVTNTAIDSRICIFRDGSLLGLSTVSSAIVNENTDLRIGKGPFSASPHFSCFNGYIDEFRWYNRELNAGEILALYNDSGSCLMPDTCQFMDTITHMDTITYMDTIQVFDSIQVFDTIQVMDTIQFYDTTMVTIMDTAVFYDTTYVTLYDTIIVRDTTFITLYDTIIEYDTLVHLDTSYYNVPDTLVFSMSSVSGGFLECKIYPNPTSGFVIIELPDFNKMENYLIRLSNALGQVIYSRTVDSPVLQVDFRTVCTPGLYYLEIRDENKDRIVVKKIIIDP